MTRLALALVLLAVTSGCAGAPTESTRGALVGEWHAVAPGNVSLAFEGDGATGTLSFEAAMVGSPPPGCRAVVEAHGPYVVEGGFLTATLGDATFRQLDCDEPANDMAVPVPDVVYDAAPIAITATTLTIETDAGTLVLERDTGAARAELLRGI